MNNNLKFSNNCVSLIASSEGFSAKPYVDPGTGAEPITIGFGSTFYCDGKKVTMKDTPITKEQAQQTLLCYLNKIALPCIQKVIKADINQNMLDALGSFVYNIGCGNFTKSSVARFINTEHSKENIIDSFRMWTKGGGKVLPGLVKRRENEINLFFK